MSNPFPTGLLKPIGSSLGLATDLGLGVNAQYTDRPLPISKQVSFGVQRELWFGIMADVSYIGNFTTGLPINAALNYVPISELGKAASYYTERVTNPLAGLLPNNAALNGATIPRQSLLSAFPQYSGVTASNIPAGKNRHDSMQLTVRKRFANGLNFQVNYMAAKTLEQLQLLNPQDIRTNDLLNPVLEKRLTIFDVPQKLSFLGTYELPFGKGKKFGSAMHPIVNGLLRKLAYGLELDFPGRLPDRLPERRTA